MRIGLIAAPLITLATCATPPTPGRMPPNIVVVFTDDQGWADVGCYGAKGFETPHLDRLARDGVRFTNFYVAQPVCSASRAALLTGCYSNRVGIRGALGPRSRIGINANETTLAELCKSKGYATAIFGKWHLGNKPRFLPTRHGFDEFYGIPYSNDMWPHHPESPKAWGDLPTMEGERTVGLNTDQNRFTTDFTTRSVAFIGRACKAGKRFFLYLAHPMPHVPLHVSDKFRGKTERGLYGDVIEEVDWSVGQVMAALERNGVENDTLVVYASDNGPWLSYGNHAGTAKPLREGKGTTFDGGVRVPCIMRWPGQIPAGTVCDEPAMTIDVFPTVARAIGAELPEHPIDGLDITDLMRGKPGAQSPHEALFFWYHRGDLEGVRSGRWKLHFPHGYRSMIGRKPGRDGIPGKYTHFRTGVELYDLATDVGEATNVIAAHPEVRARLERLADAMRRRLGDRLTKTKGSEVRAPGRVEK